MKEIPVFAGGGRIQVPNVINIIKGVMIWLSVNSNFDHWFATRPILILLMKIILQVFGFGLLKLFRLYGDFPAFTGGGRPLVPLCALFHGACWASGSAFACRLQIETSVIRILHWPNMNFSGHKK